MSDDIYVRLRRDAAASLPGFGGAYLTQVADEIEALRAACEAWQREVGGRDAEIDRLTALLLKCRKVLDGEWAKAEKRKRLIDRIDAVLGGRDA